MFNGSEQRGLSFAVNWSMQMLLHDSVPGCRDCVTYWDNSRLANDYDVVAGDSHWSRAVVQILEDEGISRETKILDIGAGTGTHVLPLAPLAGLVTAVEPAPTMMKRLLFNLSQLESHNVRCVDMRWEDVEPSLHLDCPYDFVIASFSLGMVDIDSAIEKMCRSASGRIILLWNYGTPSWERIYRDLWPAVHGAEYIPMPDSDCLTGVLREMGKEPALSYHDTGNRIVFRDLDQAVDHYCEELSAFDDKQRRAIADYLRRELVPEQGLLVLNDSETYAVVTWTE